MARLPLPPPLLGRLRAVRRRRRLLGVVEALAWTALGLGLLVAAAPLARGLTEGLGLARMTARVIVAASVVVPLLALALPAWLRTRDLLRVARAVDDGVPELHAGAHAAVDLAQALHSGSVPPDGIVLAERHLAQASALAEAHVDPARLLPWSRLGRKTLVGPAVAGTALLGTALAPQPVTDGLQRLFGELPVAAVDAEPAPEPATMTLRNLRIQLVPPGYSGRPARDLPGTTGDFQALAGTQVRWEADGPGGKGATLVFEGLPESVEPIAGSNDGGTLAFDWTVPDGLRTYRVLVPRGLGRDPLRSRAYTVELIPDRAPSLEVTGPRDRPEIRPEQEVAVGVRAGDDFGLTQVKLVVERKGRVVVTKDVAELTGDKAWDGTVRWRPADDLQDGQGGDLDLIVEAWDNNGVKGPQVTRARAIEIYVPTPRDRHRQVLQLKEQLLDKTVVLLADLLEDTYALGAVAAREEVTGQQDRHDAAVAEVLDVGARLAEAMAADRFERQEVFLGIGGALANLATVWEPVQGYVQAEIRPYRSGVVGQDKLMMLVAKRQPPIEELERIVLDLASFIDIHLADEAANSVADLEPDLADLSDLLRQAQDGKPVAEQLSKALDQLKQSLAEIAQKLSQRLDAPDDGFLNEMPEQLQESKLAELERLIEEGKYEEAMQRLQEMMEAVEQQRQDLESAGQDNAGSQDRQELNAQLQEAIDQAKQLEEQQKELLDQTEQLAGDEGQGVSDEEMQKLAEELAEAQKLLDEAAPKLSGKPASLARFLRRMASREAQQGADALRAGDLDAAAQHAANAADAAAEMNLEANALQSANGKEARRLGEQAQRKAEDVLKKLEEAADRAAAQRQRAQQAGAPLAGKQDQLGRGVEQLRQQMGEIQSGAFNPQGGRQSLDAAQQLMEGAGQRLAEGRPGSATQGQKDALKQLQAFRESLEQSQQAMQPGQRMGGQGMAQRPGGQQRGQQDNPWDDADDWGGQSLNSGEVELSDPDDFVSPEAFRRLVQEGAADETPDRYRPVHERYYEELVK